MAHRAHHRRQLLCRNDALCAVIEHIERLAQHTLVVHRDHVLRQQVREQVKVDEDIFDPQRTVVVHTSDDVQ